MRLSVTYLRSFLYSLLEAARDARANDSLPASSHYDWQYFLHSIVEWMDGKVASQQPKLSSACPTLLSQAS